MVKNAENFDLASFVLFEETLSVRPEKYITALQAILNYSENYDFGALNFINLV
jgi:hypothetical protein